MSLSSKSLEKRKKLPVVQQRSSISHSEMGAYGKCGWKWHLDYEQGLRSREQNIAFCFGDAIHFAIENLLCAEEDKRVSLETALDLFSEKYYKRMETVPSEQFVQYVDFEGEKLELFSHPVVDVLPVARRILEDLLKTPEILSSKILANEMKIDEEITRTDDRKIRFKGAIDMLLGTGKPGKMKFLICDTKTCTWGWPYEKKRDEHILAQVMLYKHFICKVLDLDPKHVQTAFLLLKKTPGKKDPSSVEFFKPSSGPKSVDQAVEKLQTTVSEMMSDEIPLNRESCRSRFGDCPYLDSNLCPNSDGSYSKTIELKPRYLEKTDSLSTVDESKENTITE